MKAFNYYTILTLVLFTVITSCSQAAITPTATSDPTATPVPILKAGTSDYFNLPVNGLKRSYRLYVPLSVIQSTHPVPVVFGFHCLQCSFVDSEQESGFDDIADQAGFIVVYPQGFGDSWNGGTCCGDAVTNNVDEPAFVRKILSDLGTIAKIDSKRVYAAGFSNGGILVYRLACEMSDTFAAVASVSGTLTYSPCQPSQPISIIHVHGLADTTIPYTGGKETEAGVLVDFPPVEQVITMWLKLDGCTGAPQVGNEKSATKNIITHKLYTACKAGTAVELYTSSLGSHSWPSKYDWPASQVIWDFFAAHPKP